MMGTWRHMETTSGKNLVKKDKKKNKVNRDVTSPGHAMHYGKEPEWRIQQRSCVFPR
jgi:hypothetical protein